MAIISELFIKLGLSSASLDKGLEQTKLKVRQTAKEVRKETGEARDAVNLLGRVFGVQLPAQVQKFAASVAPVRQLLAGAFRASIVAGFTVAIGAAVVKAVEWFNVWRSGAEVFGEIEKRLAGMTTAFEKFGAAELQGARASISGQIAAAEARLAGLGALEAGGGAALHPQDPLGIFSRVASSIAANAEIKKVGAELDKLRGIEAQITGVVGQRNKEREDELRKVQKLKDRLGEMPALVRNIHTALGGARSLSLLPELTPQGAIGQGGIFGFLRGLDEAEQAVFARFAQQTTQEIFTRGRVGKFADFDREVKKVAESANLLKANFVQAFQAIGQDLENAIVQFKGFGNVMLSVLQEIQRALVRTFVISPFVSFLTKGLGALLGAGGGGAIKVGGLSFPPVPTPPIPRQHGGPVFPGQSYLLGEGGMAERLTMFPGGGGVVTPLAAGGGRGGVTINQHIDARGGAPGIEHRIREVLVALSRATKNAAVLEMRETAARSL